MSEAEALTGARARRRGTEAGRRLIAAGHGLTAAERGLTVVELAIVLLVAGALLAVGLGALEVALPTWRVREASSTLASALRAARVAAIVERHEVTVPFDVGRRRYSLGGRGAAGGVSTGTDVEGAVYRVVDLPPGVSFARPDAGEPVTLTPPGLLDRAAVFSPKGRLLAESKPGYAHLGHPGRGIYMRVRVNVVGTVTVERWDGSGWR